MPATCRYWRDQKDGFHGNCCHPEAQPGESCLLNTEDKCVLLEEFIPVHTCAVCGATIPVEEYEKNGCTRCGADSEEVGQ